MENTNAPPAAAPQRKALVLGLMGLAVFLAVEALLLRSFMRKDTRPPSREQSIHMEIALNSREALKVGELGAVWSKAPGPGLPAFPPLYHLLLSRAYDLADPFHVALWINWFYLALLSISIFGLAWSFRPDETALAATVMFIASPGIQGLLTTQLIDLPMVALAAAAYWALIVSEGFSGWTASLLFGILHAAGMLHNWSFLGYMLPAYWIALSALGNGRSVAVMLSAAALSTALIFPWYSTHLALLSAWWASVSAGFTISTWRAWGSCFQQASNALGPIFWIMGIFGLLAPQFQRRREQSWIPLAWVLASCVSWNFMPNREVRFLLPGLVPLGVAFCSTWPKSLTWSVAGLQLLGLLNYFGGWIGPIAVKAPFYRLEFFANRPPLSGDWKIEEILRKIEAERDPSRPVTDLALAAEDERLNVPLFRWTQRRLGLGDARTRDVQLGFDHLSEFVLMKYLTPVPAWFPDAYEEVARWSLPDKSSAVLFHQRRVLNKS